jgi:predicted lysophospholipase L1 biosynthesis ABC-type transport system permease subunit
MQPNKAMISVCSNPALLFAAMLAVAVLAEPALAQVDPTAVFSTKFSQAAQNMKVIGSAIAGLAVVVIGTLVVTGQEVSRWVWSMLYGVCIISGGAAIAGWLTA